MNVGITIDDIRLKSNLNNNQTLIFTKKYCSIVQLISGSYKSDKPYNLTAIDNVHLKYDCFIGSIVNGIRELFGLF